MVADVIISAGDVRPERVSGKNVAVIDVFRATSVIVTALNNGARRVIPVVHIEEARELRDKYGRRNTLMGGERNTVLIEGFDKDNSPLAYTPEDVAGKTIVFTTTNGTRAIYNSRAASAIYIAAFINVAAVCRRLAASGKEIVLVCAGRSDHFTAEDGLCAGAMAQILARDYGYRLTDLAEVMRDMYAFAGEDLKGRLSSTLHYNFMLGKKYFDDIDYCLGIDRFDAVPVYDKVMGEVVLER